MTKTSATEIFISTKPEWRKNKATFSIHSIRWVTKRLPCKREDMTCSVRSGIKIYQTVFLNLYTLYAVYDSSNHILETIDTFLWNDLRPKRSNANKLKSCCVTTLSNLNCFAPVRRFCGSLSSVQRWENLHYTHIPANTV